MIISAPSPVVRDCSEIERLGGFPVSGEYFLSAKGPTEMSEMYAAYCHQGWTYVLKRDQVGNPEVSVWQT